MSPAISVEVLTEPADMRLRKMTFPAYRHLLDLAPAPRILRERNEPTVHPLALAAKEEGGDFVGLCLVALPTDGLDRAELLSVFVSPSHRGRGVGTAMLDICQEILARLGVGLIWCTYTVSAWSPVVERLFTKLGWEKPRRRSVSVQVRIRKIMDAPWVGRYRLRKGAKLVLLSDVDDEKIDEARRLQETEKWIPEDLEVWRYLSGFDPSTSLGLILEGRLVGWVITHGLDEKTLRYTCAFVREDLARLGRLVPMLSESLKLADEANFSRATFVTRTSHPAMLRFIHRHIEPWAERVSEVRYCEKRLG